MKHDDPNPTLSYIRQLYAQEDSLLQTIRQTFEERGMAIQVGAEEGKLLHMLLCLHKAHTVVEIGTLGGYSAIWMARALPTKGHLHTVEHEAAHAELAREFIKQSDVRDKITVWEGKAQDVLNRIAEVTPQVDAVFIDADKISYPQYLDWAEAHLKPGGLLIADNTLLFGSVYLDSPPDEDDENYPTIRQTTWQAMRNFNARLAENKHFDTIMLPTDQGMTVAIRKGESL